MQTVSRIMAVADPRGPIRVAALYQFTRFDDCAALQAELSALCVRLGVRGTLLLAREGLNGTIAGSDEGVEAVLDHLRALPGCATLDVNSLVPLLRSQRKQYRPSARLVTRGKIWNTHICATARPSSACRSSSITSYRRRRRLVIDGQSSSTSRARALTYPSHIAKRLREGYPPIFPQYFFRC